MLVENTDMPRAFLSPLEIMTKLVSFPTVSSESNLKLVSWIQDYFDSHGIKSFCLYDESGEKASLFAHVGPERKGGIVLSGHMDVVPTTGQDWSKDPWTVVENEGKYFGRGVCDMKGFDAIAIWAVVEANRRDLQRPLQIALSYDEEVGCRGAPPMIKKMLQVLPKASVVIVGEPSRMKPVTAHKGSVGHSLHVIGFEVHSSIAHTGVSAIMAGAKIIDWVNEVNAANKMAKPSETAAIFDPPYTTAHVGMISGGTAHNITAKDCYFSVDFRVNADETPGYWYDKLVNKVTEVEKEIKSVRPEARIDITPGFFVPGLRPEIDGEAESLVRQITGDNGTHVVSYGTEAGQFQQEGFSAVICGPGDIAQAHQPDEFIEISQFRAGQRFMASLIDCIEKH